MKPKIGITMGDPCGIGPEVIVKGLQNSEIYQVCHPLVIGDFAQIQYAAASFAPKLRVSQIEKAADADFIFGQLEVIDISDKATEKTTPYQYGVCNPAGALAALKTIERAAKMVLRNEINAIATAPIHKEGMRAVGFSFPGHTEFFAKASGTDCFGMMMLGNGLKIMLASIHLPLKDAISQLNKKKILKTIQLTASALDKDFGLSKPHIAVAGLNPHAGEQGLLGMEEKTIVSPAIEMAKQEGLNVSGPYPADTLFYKLQEGKFDAAVALYHDQALIPIKLVSFGTAVNITVGLPFIRTSVDHGTAFDIAGKGIANPGSLQEAVKLAAQMACHRVAIQYDKN